MSLSDIVRKAGVFLTDMEVIYEVGRIIRSDRLTGALAMEAAVDRLTPEKLCQFEIDFLKASAFGMFTPEERIRAMELYSVLKVTESTHYGRCQFSTATKGGPLA